MNYAIRYITVTLSCLLIVAWRASAQPNRFAGVSNLRDFVAMRESPSSVLSSSSISARTFSDAVSRAIPEIQTSISSKTALDRTAFEAGVDRVSVDTTDAFGPQHLTQSAALDIGQAGQAFLETASSTAKRLNVPSGDISSQFAGARIEPDFTIMPRPFRCPFRKPWPTCDERAKYRSIDGTCNNVRNSLWGKSLTPFERSLTPDYADGISSPRTRSVNGGPLPNARKISRDFHTSLSVEDKQLSHFAMEFGQFVSHDIQFNALSQGYRGSNLNCCERPNRQSCFPIQIPPGDPFFTNRTCLNLVRSLPTPNLDCILGVREQLNQNTHFLDGSLVYGSDKATSDGLRTFTGGLLKTSAADDLLPQNSGANAGCTITVASRPCFRAGDPRVNQQPALISLHTIWMREHNRVAKQLALVQPTWRGDDEKLFQEARRIVVAMIQHITYSEFLPEVLGNSVMTKYGLKPKINGYTGYNPREKPMIRNGFMAAAYRFGHSMISDHLPTHNGFLQTSNSLLKDTFLKPDLVYTKGVDEITRGLTRSKAEDVDKYISAQVTRHLFERRPGFGGDLAATNIQRARDHGIPSYQKWRRHCGLSGQYSHAYHVRSNLQQIYSNPDDMDLFTAGVSETAVPGGKVGPTFACMIGEQFRSLKNGDRFYYEHDEVGKFTPEQLREIRGTTMSKVMCRNTGIPHLQRNAFKDVISGNPIVNCRTMKDIDFSNWGTNCQSGGGWSAWQTTPCFGNWRLRYRICTSSGSNQCGNPCPRKYEIKVESCGWIWEPLWPRDRPQPPQRPFVADRTSISDIQSRIETKLTSLINSKKGNIDAKLFEQALSAVSPTMSRA
ncbi:peroxidase-like isoform X2 [Ruditapes philippinarum]|uniref:peroxidase-like isoform X2 n=1 Tax=Ruditapes philippinarum TaxID=129788 RepID=UPI00295B8A4B|nr:peroxidase-like isoform X2 [Ruditapes philippinarum]